MTETKRQDEHSGSPACSLEQREKDAREMIEIRRRNPQLIVRFAKALQQDQEDEIEAAWLARG